MRGTAFLVVTMVLALLQGCGGQQIVDFAVPPPGIRTRQAGAEAVMMKISVEDRRTDKTIIGTARKPGTGGVVLTVAPRSPLEEMARMAALEEFAARGYRMGGDEVFLLIDIINARADISYLPLRTRVDGSVSLLAKVMRADGRQMFEATFRREIRTEVESFALLNRMDEGGVEIGKAMRDLLCDMADDQQLTRALVAPLASDSRMGISMISQLIQ